MKIQSLVPDYYDKFSCIGSECEDNCCHGWTVSIDKKTYKDMKRIKNPKWQKEFKNHYKRIRKEGNDSAYAYIKMNECGSCPFLNEQQLCNIHADLGEKYLSQTCTVYPRLHRELNGIIESSLAISCPEVARIVLLNSEPMEFIQTEREMDSKLQIAKLNLEHCKDQQQYFWDMRIAAITILQDRTYNIEDRLIILGLAMQRIQEKINGKEYEYIPEILQSYLMEMKEEEFRQHIRNIPQDTTGKMKLYTDVLTQRLQKVIRKHYLILSSQISQGLTGKDDVTIEEICERYDEIQGTIYKPYMQEHSYILENYLVNYVFQNLFPLLEKTWLNSYFGMATNYLLLKTQIVGLAGYYGELNEKIVIDLFYSFSRSFEHDTQLKKVMSAFLKHNEYDNLSNLAMLIKG
ncbi:flagellin lysine-N-methylase [Microbacteriaceae bacterium 4G12]